MTGPYRRTAREHEDPPRRGIQTFVTWTGALVILAVVGVVVEGATRGMRTESGVREATEALGPRLRDERIAELARRFDPRELEMPAVPELAPGERADGGAVVRIERDGDLSRGLRGALVRTGRPRIDTAHVELGTLAATQPDELRWIGIVRRRTLHDAYTFGAVSVDVERMEVAIVDLERGTLVARVAIQAAPPASTQSALAEYRVPGSAIRDAIADALAP